MNERSTSPRPALALLLALLALFHAPRLLRGEVVYPHDNSLELGAPPVADGSWTSNRKFSDQSSVYVPEIRHHLRGDHLAWLSTWNPHVELGRPSIQLAGFSPAFLPTRVLMWLCDDPFVVYSWLVLLTSALLGLFTFLFLRELALDPWACCAVSAGLALGPFVSYWLTFVMFVSGLCWTMALLWSIARFLRRPAAGAALAVVFSVHALLLTAYPQQIVWHLYLVGAFTLWSLARAPERLSRNAEAAGRGVPLTLEGSMRARVRARLEGCFSGSDAPARRVRAALALLALGVLGLASALPAYADVALQAARSARLASDPSFFDKALPELAGWADVARSLGQLFDAFWSGNPSDESYPLAFNGLCFTPLFAGLMPLCLLEGGWRRSAPWVLFGLLCSLFTAWPAAYRFGVEHLGLHLSIFTPLAAALIPGMVCAALAIDQVRTRGLERRERALVLQLLVAVPSLAAAFLAEEPVRPAFVALSLLIHGICAVFVWTRSALALVAALVLSVFHHGYRVVLARPESAIRTDSPLVEALRAATPGESRYAIVGSEQPRLLPANLEVFFGLHSIHSYNSLSSRAYQGWLQSIDDKGARVLGRRFPRLASAAHLGREEMTYAGIATLASFVPIERPEYVRAGSLERPALYAAREAPILAAEILDFARGADGAVTLAGTLASHRRLALEELETHDDFRRLRLTPSEQPTLLFLSQQHHPHWSARSDGTSLECVPVNGLYLGVLVPPGTDEVELEFRPWVRWMWVVQAAFVLLALAWLARAGILGTPRAQRAPAP